MKRGTRGRLLRALRNYVREQQQAIAMMGMVDVSTISRIEAGIINPAEDIEWAYLQVCGGERMLRSLIDDAKDMLERFTSRRPPLLPV